MAGEVSETNLTLVSNLEYNAKNIYVVKTASSIPADEYVYFKANFTAQDGTTFSKAIKDSSGTLIKITSADDMAVIDNIYGQVTAVYYGDNMPSDLKVYKF